MQGDQIVREIQTPQSVTINAGEQAGMPYGAQPVQPMMQQNIVLAVILTVIGLFFALGIFALGFNL